MGTLTSVTIIGISLIIIALTVWLLERKYTKSGIALKNATGRITVLESTADIQANAIAAVTSKVDAIGSEQTKDRIKIGGLQESKIPPTPSTQNDPAMTLLTTAAVVGTFDSPPSYSSGSCSSSDSGSSYDSSSSCSSSSDSY
ncbi:hypothetical protein FKOIJHOC_00041 [Acinetobacter phage Ab_121]|nr:hypothetical protein FKOIJHOC_00041 [Acinetobacter phage Ab_121]UYL86168.1 hypothetical protein [Acinetobacter phage vB_AbaM_CP14]